MYDLKQDTDFPLAEFTNDFIECKLDKVERAVFEEYLSVDSKLATFVLKSKQGKRALQKAFTVSSADDFEEKLARRIAKENQSISPQNSADLASA